MKLLKKIMLLVIVVFITAETFIGAVPNNILNTSIKPINIGVVFYTFDDPYVTLLRQSLENIEKKNEGKVKFSFYDSKNNKSIQNENINLLLENKNTDILILSLVDLINDPKEIIGTIKEKNIPTIFVSKRTSKVDKNIIESYEKAYYVVPDSEQAGRLQGQIIIDIWNKKNIDTNRDNIMQYVMLQGIINNAETIERSKYSIMTIEDAGIKTERLAEAISNWNEDMAREAMEGLFIRYGNKIEMIISNNDAMAIGAIKALQKYGYNKGDNTKNIPVIGIDAIPEAREFIKKGYMSGTVLQDPNVMAEVLYEVGMNLANNKKFNCIREYKCDVYNRIIELPFKEYVS